MRALTPDEIDVLTEIINIGVGRAAGSLSDIIGSHVILKVPHVELLPLEGLHEVALKLGHERISSVIQTFQGSFIGSAALVFPPDSAARLVSALTGDHITSPNLDSVRSGTLMEIGNIVINGILGTISNILKCNLHFSLPEFRDINKIMELVRGDDFKGDAGFIVFAEANFSIKALEISGFIVILFEIDSMDYLASMIENATLDGTIDGP
ncbi:MAG: chemotaxis protein CheC [Deltaproteobacteria bacterium]|nr:chemotaxis protein CheC [Deltaproteobacteria bacterium]